MNRNTMNQIRFVLASLMALVVVGSSRAEPVDVIVRIDAQQPGDAISPMFSGFSFETRSILPDASGHYLFDPQNKPLMQIFATLGIKSLRIGGNSADNPDVPIPSDNDIDNLFAFAQ